jgi:hypothetical protein
MWVKTKEQQEREREKEEARESYRNKEAAQVLAQTTGEDPRDIYERLQGKREFVLNFKKKEGEETEEGEEGEGETIVIRTLRASDPVAKLKKELGKALKVPGLTMSNLVLWYMRSKNYMEKMRETNAFGDPCPIKEFCVSGGTYYWQKEKPVQKPQKPQKPKEDGKEIVEGGPPTPPKPFELSFMPFPYYDEMCRASEDGELREPNPKRKEQMKRIVEKQEQERKEGKHVEHERSCGELKGVSKTDTVETIRRKLTEQLKESDALKTKQELKLYYRKWLCEDAKMLGGSDYVELTDKDAVIGDFMKNGYYIY